MNRNQLRVLTIWLGELWPLWICVVTTVFTLGFLCVPRFGELEARARWAGTILQILGLAATAIGIHQTKRQFHQPGTLAWLKEWISRRPKPNVTVQLTGSAIITSSGSAALGVGQVSPPPNATNEERIKRLEQLLPLIEQRITDTDKRITDETAARVQSDTQEQNDRKQADAELRNLTEVFATGGLTISALGLWCLLLGTILAGFAPDIAVLMRH